MKSGPRYICTDCYSVNMVCVSCGEYTDACMCDEDDLTDALCMSCGETTKAVEASTETWQVNPDCRHVDEHPNALVCAICEVYRRTVNSPWEWAQSAPFCSCNPEAATQCKRCGVVREDVLDVWKWDDPLSYYSYKCRHYDHPIEFPDGTVVYASSLRDRETSELAPDFGLYLDGGWTPSCLNYHVGWTDYGLPNRWELAATMIVDAWRKAEDRQWVEVGCLGGHGRTGTVLACMAIMSGVPASEAVAWVRANYCSEAIESSEQEWWVRWFNCFLNGGITPLRPWPSWYGKKDKKHNKHFVRRYECEGFDWRSATIFQATHNKPVFEYGAVISRTVRKKIVEKDDAELVDITLEAGS